MTNEIAVPANDEQSALPGVNVLLMGPSGTGKTFAIGTLVDAGVEVFYLALESGMESLLGYWKDKGKPVPDNLHWHKLKAPKASFAELMDSATKINTLSLDSLAKMVDPNKSKHNQFIELLTTLNSFTDQRTGENFGPVDEWPIGRCLVIDGMTGLAQCAMSLVIGGKAVKNQSDWGIAQDQVERLLRKLTSDCACHLVLIAHVERETDQVLGGIKLMISTLGKALSPKIPGMFSDVILATREGTKYTWDTASAMADVKTRNLPIASGLSPNFAPIITKWLSRGGVNTKPANN
jgi:hypothetical protein